MRDEDSDGSYEDEWKYAALVLDRYWNHIENVTDNSVQKEHARGCSLAVSPFHSSPLSARRLVSSTIRSKWPRMLDFYTICLKSPNKVLFLFCKTDYSNEWEQFETDQHPSPEPNICSANLEKTRIMANPKKIPAFCNRKMVLKVCWFKIY